MQQADITFLRAFKVWWSFAWRYTGLWRLLAIVLGLWVHQVLHARPHVAPTPEEFRHNLVRLIWEVWLPFFVVAVVVQTFATRWALRRARWSDFRLQAVALDHGTSAA
jgi:hypothetical protein